MALTQISTAGVKDDAVTSGKIPANAVGSSELADNAVDTAAIADDAVTAAKLASDAVVTASIVDDAITSAKIANGAVDTAQINNDAITTQQIADGTIATGDIADSAVTTAKIADQAVDLTKLPHGTSSNDGKFLRANNGADPSFETVSIPAGTTINNNADNRVITGSGTANTLEGEANLTFNGTNLLTVHVPSATGEPAINFTNSDTGTGSGNGFGLGINSSESPYIWNRENTDLRIATNNTERMRVDSSGRVGIGVTDVSNYWEGGDQLVIKDTGTGGCGITIHADTDDESGIFFADGTTGNAKYEGYIQYDHSDNSMRFATTATERMRVDSSGNVGIGTSTPAEKLTVDGGDISLVAAGAERMNIAHSGGGDVTFNQPTAASTLFKNQGNTRIDISHDGTTTLKYSSNQYFRLLSSGDVSVVRTSANSGNAGMIVFHDGNDDFCGQITSNGANNTTSFVTNSDYRLKTNASLITDGITRIKNLKPYRFEWKTDLGIKVDGFFAHEAQAVVPEAVTGVKDEMKSILYKEGDELPEGKKVGDVKETVPKIQGIDQAKIVPLLTAALQEAVTKIETLETKVAALEAA